MKKPTHSEWRLSVMALTAFIGGIIGIYVVNREINSTFVFWYLTALVLVTAANAIYVFYKRKKNNGVKNQNNR